MTRGAFSSVVAAVAVASVVPWLAQNWSPAFRESPVPPVVPAPHVSGSVGNNDFEKHCAEYIARAERRFGGGQYACWKNK